MKKWLLIPLLFIAWTADAGLPQLRGGIGNPSAYTDFCSLPNASCASAMSIEQRLVSTAPATAYTLTRFSDSAVENIGYTGATFTTNTAAAITFCLGNGGTTTVFTGYVKYNDCGISQINDQTGKGCNPSQATQAHMLPFDVRSDGKPASIVPVQGRGSTAPGSKWMSASGCSVPCPGKGPRTAIIRSQNLGFSGCCGTQGGCAENVFKVTPGTMYALAFYHNHGQINFGGDAESGGTCNKATPVTLTPVVDVVGIVAYSGADTNHSNTYCNGSRIGPVDCTPSVSINSQTRFLIGISGDGESAGPLYFRSLVFTTDDVAATPELPTKIYNYLSAL